MGLLDSKTRIFDSIVTSEGKRQIALGKLQVGYVSFSDSMAVYASDLLSGSQDASETIYFEAHNGPSDAITLETAEAPRLLLSGTTVFETVGSRILSGSSRDGTMQLLTGSAFASMAGLLLSSSLYNFRNLSIIGTTDPFLDSHEFHITPQEFTFTITENSPLRSGEIKTLSVDRAESLFQDKRLSNTKSFKYMPPVIDASKAPDKPNVNGKAEFANFARLGQEFSYGQLSDILSVRPSANVDFSETSRENNLAIQMFEQSNDGLTKLDVVDFGQFVVGDPAISRRVFFVGKVFKDGQGFDTFVNMFTLVFEHDFA